MNASGRLTLYVLRVLKKKKKRGGPRFNERKKRSSLTTFKQFPRKGALLPG